MTQNTGIEFNVSQFNTNTKSVSQALEREGETDQVIEGDIYEVMKGAL